jgi:hypothetical protein
LTIGKRNRSNTLSPFGNLELIGEWVKHVGADHGRVFGV